MSGHRIAHVLVLAAILGFAGEAWAQGDDEFANPNTSQMQLYKDGSTAFAAGQYEDAVRLFKASLVVGELNITWLNLGRAHFKLGQCSEAREAFAKVRKAPKVRDPAPEDVMIRLNEYLVDLEASCKAADGPVAVASCPEGKVVTEDTAGQCCWPGQAWDGSRCVGVPSSCPAGNDIDFTGQSCVCSGGRERVEGGHCCWEGQAWSGAKNQCVGLPTACPAGAVMRGDRCVDFGRNAASLGINQGGFRLTYERLLTDDHSVHIGLGTHQSESALPLSLISPGPGASLNDLLTANSFQSSGVGLTLGYRWLFQGGIDSYHLGGHLSAVKYGLVTDDVTFGSGNFEVEVEGKLQLEAAISAGKRWVWSPGFALLAGLGVGGYVSGYSVACVPENFLDGAEERACLATEGDKTDVGVMINLELSVGWAF